MPKHFKYVLEFPVTRVARDKRVQRISFVPGKPKHVHLGQGLFVTSAVIRPADKSRLLAAAIITDKEGHHRDVFFFFNRDIIQKDDPDLLRKLGFRQFTDLFPYDYQLLKKKGKKK